MPNNGTKQSASAASSSSSTPLTTVATSSRSSGEQPSGGGKGGGKGGKGSNIASITPISASDSATAAASAHKKAYSDNSEKFDTDEQEKVDGFLCVNAINLARRMIVKGDSEAAKHYLDAATLSMVGLEHQGRLMEARLHGNVNEEMFNAEDPDEKFAILARAFQANSVAVDALTVLASTILQKLSGLERELVRPRGGLGTAQANAAAVAPAPVIADGPGVSPACGRRLKEVFKRDLFQNPLLVIVGHFVRRKTSEAYSHTREEKLTQYVRRVVGVSPAIFGGVSVDIILAQTSTDQIVTTWNKWHTNTRSKFNETLKNLARLQDVGTLKLAIKEGETAEVAMTERVLEALTLVFKAWNMLMASSETIDIDALEDPVDYMQKLSELGMNWLIIAYVVMVGARLICPEARGFGDQLSLKNPLHGLLFWYIVKEFLCYTVRTFNMRIPGLNTDDGDADTEKLSSLESVEALAVSKIASLTSYCDQQGITVPDFAKYFFKDITDEAGPNDLEEELQLESSSSEDGGPDDDDNDDEGEGAGSAETAGPKRQRTGKEQAAAKKPR